MKCSELRDWSGEKLCRRTVDALKENGFKAVYCKTAAEAKKYILKEAEGAGTIGCGGSLTLTEMGVYDELEKRGQKVLNHGVAGLSPEEKLAVRRRQLTCDLFLSGLNAVTVDGEIVNIDGVGNRVAAMIFGPGKVILVGGRNKIVDGSLEDAILRVRNYSAPMNGKRLGLKTPCALTGECEDCQSPDRMCRVTTILSMPPRVTDMRVLIVNEELGL